MQVLKVEKHTIQMVGSKHVRSVAVIAAERDDIFLNACAVVSVLDGVRKEFRPRDLAVLDSDDVPAIITNVERVDLRLGQPVGTKGLAKVFVDGQGGTGMFADHELPTAQTVGDHQDQIVMAILIQCQHQALPESVVELFQITAPYTKTVCIVIYNDNYLYYILRDLEAACSITTCISPLQTSKLKWRRLGVKVTGLLQRGRKETGFCLHVQIEQIRAECNQEQITHLNGVKDMTPALKAGKQLTLEVEAKQLIRQGDLVAGKIIGQQSERPLGIAAIQSARDRIAFVGICECRLRQ